MEGLRGHVHIFREVDTGRRQQGPSERTNSNDSELAALAKRHGAEPLAAIEGVITYCRERRGQLDLLQIAALEGPAVVLATAPKRPQAVVQFYLLQLSALTKCPCPDFLDAVRKLYLFYLGPPEAVISDAF